MNLKKTKHKNKKNNLSILSKNTLFAESEGFEPPLPLRVNMLSKHAPSATRPTLQRAQNLKIITSIQNNWIQIESINSINLFITIIHKTYTFDTQKNSIFY